MLGGQGAKQGRRYREVFEPGEWVRVHPVEGSEVSQQASRQHAGQRGRVIVQAMLPGGDYTVQLENGLELRLPEAALTGVPTDEYGDPLLCRVFWRESPR
jgi:hypothetical protein